MRLPARSKALLNRFFAEAFARYIEAVVMEKCMDRRAVYRLSENANRRYFTGRAYATEPEPPFFLVNGQGYLSYG
jgi:hypothetical protein